MIINKALKYCLYFVVFIFFVQIVENDQFQKWFAHFGLKVNLEPIGTYAPLFLSVLLIDVTYQIGKQQNKIAERQNRIDRHRMYKEMYSLLVHVDKVSNKLVSDLYKVFCSIDRTENKQKILQMQSDYATCLHRVKECEIDFHILKSNQKDQLYVKVEELVQSATTIMFIVSIFDDLYAGKITELKYPQRNDIIEIDDPDIDVFTRNFIQRMIELNEMSPMHLVDTIDVFLRKRKELFGSENNILNMIKEEADADYHASC